MELWLILTGCMAILLLTAIAGCYLVIKWSASPRLYDDAGAVPLYGTALVLGAAKFTRKGQENLFFRYRMDAAERIFLERKAFLFIASGASERPGEPREGDEMKAALAARGLPPESIIADNYGYRTWDSLWRCRHVYGHNRVLVISQRFHTERAVFTGRRRGMDVVGFNADRVRGRIAFKMFLRECLARVKCILDCYLLHPRPVFIRKDLTAARK